MEREQLTHELGYHETKRWHERMLKRGSMVSYGEEGVAFLVMDDQDREIAISGRALVDLLLYIRDYYAGQVSAARAALEQHGVNAPELSLSGSIHLLVGRLRRN